MDKTDHGLAGCGSMRFAAALVICRWSGTAFGLFHVAGHCRGGRVRGGWRGIFSTEGKGEILYGICAAACLFCMIVQTAMAV